jgi:hypothetical protein
MRRAPGGGQISVEHDFDHPPATRLFRYHAAYENEPIGYRELEGRVVGQASSENLRSAFRNFVREV